jgi:hypothetical protein
VMNRKRFAGSRMNRLRQMPGNRLGNRNGSRVRSDQRRHMQRLADVAGSVPSPIFVFVEKRPDGGEVEERKAGEQRQRAPRGNFPENVFHETHASFSLHRTVSP